MKFFPRKASIFSVTPSSFRTESVKGGTLNADVSNEMENVFHDREGVCPMDAMPKLAEV